LLNVLHNDYNALYVVYLICVPFSVTCMHIITTLCPETTGHAYYGQ